MQGLKGKEKQFISSLKVGSEVETEVLVVDAQLTNYNSPSRAGEQFLRLLLGDKSGTIRGIIWDTKKLTREVANGDILSIKGDVNEYHGLQVVIKEAYHISSDKIDRSLFQPVAPQDPGLMLQELEAIIKTEVKDRYLKTLLDSFFRDEVFLKKFKEAPAAKTIHHNYIGGLLEHSLETVAFCQNIARMQPEYINKDLLITGALLHDVGKVEEYDTGSFNFEITDRGKLIGHITLGRDLLRERVAQIADFPEEYLLELEHIILSHHGQREWGSPEIPKTIHAFAVFHADLVGARLNQFALVLKKGLSVDSAWTEWDRYLERSVFTKNAAIIANGTPEASDISDKTSESSECPDNQKKTGSLF